MQENKETAIRNTLRNKFCEFNTIPAHVGGALRRRRLLSEHHGGAEERPRTTLPEMLAASFLRVSPAFLAQQLIPT